MTYMEELPPPEQKLGVVHNGINYSLEDYADEMLAESRRRKPRAEDDDPYEFLSPGQLDRRRSREIYNGTGFPEPHKFSGLYRRAYNPLINERKRAKGPIDGTGDLDGGFPVTSVSLEGWFNQ